MWKLDNHLATFPWPAFLLFCFLPEVLSVLTSTNGEKLRRTEISQPLLSENTFNDIQSHNKHGWSGRKSISHKHSSVRYPLHDRPPHPCRYKHCYPGRKCVVENNRPKCVCKPHCRSAGARPLCGSDDFYYASPCEMHRTACLTSQNIYDARHKDCFYLKSECDADDFSKFQNALLDSPYARPASTAGSSSETSSKIRPKRSFSHSSHHQHKHHHRRKKGTKTTIPPLNGLDIASDFGDEANAIQISAGKSTPKASTILTQRDGINGGTFSLSSPKVIESSETSKLTAATPGQAEENLDYAPDLDVYGTQYDPATEQYSREMNDIITSDPKGDLVKAVFSFMDLDRDGFVGSEEVHEVTLLEDLDSIFQTPCSLYHVLHYADSDDDHAVNMHELLRIFNVTVIHLPDEDRYLSKTVNRGTSVTIQCDIQGEPNPVWRRHGQNLNVRISSGIQIDGDLVRFDDVEPRHAGNYSCSARKRPDISQVIQLFVDFPPDVQVYPLTQHRPIGSSFTVECRATGRPAPEIRWRINGEDVVSTTDGLLLLSNNTELHINRAITSDSAAYSCFASNPAGHGEDIAAVFVEDSNAQPASDIDRNVASFFAFHDSGVLVVQPRTCRTVRSIGSNEAVPGLLRQSFLCKVRLPDGERHCNWSSAVAAGSRFIYAAQPNENRIVVIDAKLQRAVEVLSTDPLPAALTYVPSTDQLFVHCWVDESRDRSTIHVIASASVPGTHIAAQVQPLDGGERVDLSVFSFFVPPENAINTRSGHAFVAHSRQQMVYMLDLKTLLYEDDVIDLRAHNCFPEDFSYQPIGGLLRVTCVRMPNDTAKSLTVDCTTRTVVLDGDTGYEREFISRNNFHAVRLTPEEQQLIVFNVTNAGELTGSTVIHTSYSVSDVAFDEKYGNSGEASVYVSFQEQDDVIYFDASSSSIQLLSSLFQPVDRATFPWSRRNRLLVPSAWYDRHIAVSGSNGLDLIDVVSNDASCRFSDVSDVTAIVWMDGDN